MIKQAFRALYFASSAVAGSLPCVLTYAATLPVPCAGGACGTGAGTFVTAGHANAVQAGSTLTINQTSANATLNWQSFDVSADGTVRFVQPNSSSVALNRIFQASPSQIFGALQANGRVFLINRNGIIFGPSAQVNVGSLLASTLDLTEAAVNGGLVAPGLSQQAALQQFTDANGLKLTSAPVTIPERCDDQDRRRRSGPRLCAHDHERGQHQHARGPDHARRRKSDLSVEQHRSQPARAARRGR